jgi:dTDP-4-dehydrorhamnose 3,5-epimerase-like enzyme
MIRFVQPYMDRSDSRGSMRGLLDFGRWEEANMFFSEANMVRGNHYHRATTEAFIMLEGRVEITLQRVEESEPVGEIRKVTAQAGDVFLIEPGTCHRFEILEPTKWINLLDRKLDPDAPDIAQPSTPMAE